MKQFPQGIFQTLNWLVKQVDLLKYQVANLVTPPTPPTNGGGLTSVAVDGLTVQGDGNIVPLSSKMQVEYIGYTGGTITISSDKNFIYIFNDNALENGTIVFPSLEVGLQLIIINMTNYNLQPWDGSSIPVVSNIVDIDLGQNNGVLATSSLYEYIGTPDGWMLIRTMSI